MKKLPTLYKLDSKGKTREWTISFDGNSFWSAQGIVGKKIHKNKPTICKPKNIGRSNETSEEEQAELEAQSKWEKKRKDGYTQDINNVKQKKFYQPMLAQNYEDRKGELSFPLYCQPKLDGVRCIILKEDGEVVAKTRNGRSIDTIPHIINKIKGFFLMYPDAILDGELYNHKLKHDFNKIISLVRKQKPAKSASDTDNSFLKKERKFEASLEESEELVEYWIYDAPNIADAKESMLFSIRFAHLMAQFSECNYIEVVPTYEVFEEGHLDGIYQQQIEEGFEGQIVRVDAGYENKRSKNLLKRKEFKDSEYVVIDIEEGDGNRVGTAKHLVCKDEKTNKTFNSNIKGTFEYLKEILDNKKEYIGKYATIKYFELTPDGIPRFPYAMSFRDYE
jgi:DNA ligase 1